MRQHRNLFIISLFITILLFLSYFLIGYKSIPQLEKHVIDLFPTLFRERRDMWLNIILGVACSMVVVCITELSGYFISKKPAIRAFIQESNKINTKYTEVMNLIINNAKNRKLQNAYLSILNLDYSVLSTTYKEIAFFSPNNNYIKHINRVNHIIYSILLLVRQKQEDLKNKDAEISRKALIILNEYMKYKINLEDNPKWKVEKESLKQLSRITGNRIEPREDKYNFALRNKDIESELLIIQNYLIKNIWYQACTPFPIGLPRSWWQINVEIIKWSKQIKEGYYNAGYDSRYIKIPFINYKIRFNFPSRLKHEDLEKNNLLNKWSNENKKG